ncbi:MAG: hypothetical protein KAT56_09860 [Sedimentisphaerales bacterium]|nr:hypothetical protein [Sedimentisphaerales bacterium]
MIHLRYVKIVMVLITLVFFVNASRVAPADVLISRITDNSVDDTNLQVSDSCAVWQAPVPDPCGDVEIFLYRGGEVLQLTDNDTDDVNPRIAGPYVAWEGWDPCDNDWEIFVYNGESVFQITDNEYDDTNPRLTDSLVFWQGSDGNDWEIFVAAIPRPTITVNMKFTPQSLNLNSRGRWITVHLWFSDEIDVKDVDTDTLLLEDLIPPAEVKLDDSSNKFTIKFDRAAVQALLPVGEAVEVEITGYFNDGSAFTGTDTIKVFDKGGKIKKPK